MFKAFLFVFSVQLLVALASASLLSQDSIEPAGPVWLNTKFYYDGDCTEPNYAGEYGLALNQCFRIQSESQCCVPGDSRCSGHCYVKHTWTPTSTVLTTTYYKDSACTANTGMQQTQTLYSEGCEARAGTFPYKAAIATSAGVPSDLPPWGRLTTITSDHSTDLMMYLYLTSKMGCTSYGHGSQFSCDSKYVQVTDRSDPCFLGTLLPDSLHGCIEAARQEVMGVVTFTWAIHCANNSNKFRRWSANDLSFCCSMPGNEPYLCSA